MTETRQNQEATFKDIKKFSLKLKLTIIFVFIATVAVLLTAFATFKKSRNALEEGAFNKLTAIREMKATQIEDYFLLMEGQIKMLSEDYTISSAIVEFQNGILSYQKVMNDEASLRNKINNYYKKEFIPRMPITGDQTNSEQFLPASTTGLGLQEKYILNNPNEVGKKDLFNGDIDSEYGVTHRKFHPFFRDFIKEFGFYDLFLIDLDGTIIYTVFKEVDFGTSLISGPYSTSNFAATFKRARRTLKKKIVYFSDFEPYAPSYNAPAAFVASPVYQNGQKVGVIALQFPIDRINSIMTNDYKWKDVGLGESGETYLVGSDYKLRNQSRFLVESPDEFFNQIRKSESTKSAEKTVREQQTTIGLLPVKTIGTKRALNGNIGTEVFPDYRGVPVLSSYKPLHLHGLDWVIMSEIDAQEAFLPITDLRETVLLIALGVIIGVILVAIITSRSIIKPLISIADFSKDLSKMNFREDDPEELIDQIRQSMDRRDELGDLTRDIARLSVNLKKSVVELIDAEKEKERMSSELNVASNIQMSMLPLTFPRFPEHLDIDVWAKLRPAREVGGDFYDFFFIDEDHFCFVIADVSGKGAPAALLMAVTKTLLKANTFDVKSPSIIIERINNEMSEDNDDCMFVTLFLGVLNVINGKLTFTNAGHNPPYLLNSDGSMVILSDVHGPMIGAMPGIKYEQDEVNLKMDSKILLYTDGVTEAFNSHKQPYGEDRLTEFLNKPKDLGPKYLVTGLFDSVDDFAGDAEQSDDITIFCLRYVAWKCRKDATDVGLTLKNELTEIDRTLEEFKKFCNHTNLNDEVQNSVSVVLDDLLNNIISYAFEESGEHEIEVSFKSDRHRLIITVIDAGVEFDPFLLKEPDTESDLDERAIGGLGIHIIKSIMDDYFYKRKNGRNHITLMKRMGE